MLLAGRAVWTLRRPASLHTLYHYCKICPAGSHILQRLAHVAPRCWPPIHYRGGFFVMVTCCKYDL